MCGTHRGNTQTDLSESYYSGKLVNVRAVTFVKLQGQWNLLFLPENDLRDAVQSGINEDFYVNFWALF